MFRPSPACALKFISQLYATRLAENTYDHVAFPEFFRCFGSNFKLNSLQKISIGLEKFRQQFCFIYQEYPVIDEEEYPNCSLGSLNCVKDFGKWEQNISKCIYRTCDCPEGGNFLTPCPRTRIFSCSLSDENQVQLNL